MTATKYPTAIETEIAVKYWRGKKLTPKALMAEYGLSSAGLWNVIRRDMKKRRAAQGRGQVEGAKP